MGVVFSYTPEKTSPVNNYLIILFLMILSLFVELNFRKCKWLLSGIYQRDDYFFNWLGSANTYDKLLLVGDFNAEEKGLP